MSSHVAGFVAGLFGEFSDRAVARVFAVVDRSGGEFEVDCVGAVAVLADEDHLPLGR